MNENNDHDYLEGIAIIGVAGRFPGAKCVDSFWENIKNGVESVTFFSEEELIASGVDPELLSDPDYVKATAQLDDIEMFDADFFGYTPREAEVMNPQHRIFLESAWTAIENAGYAPGLYNGRVGVYAGSSLNNYLIKNLAANKELIKRVGEFQILICNDKDYVATRCSYKLNLKGPSVNVSTACSTSLVAVHMACESLMNHQCDMALAGGVSIKVPQKRGYLYHKGGITSPDGHCRAFDEKAEGTINGSGVGIVVLKRLADALEDRDHIYAVIKGSSINNDGSLKVGYTAPSETGQAEVITEAQALAEVDPSSVTYIEAHGTGTPLGDPIEIAALSQAFSGVTNKEKFCAIGSVKSNFGHLDAAAGVTGLIKTAFALRDKVIPPSLHFEKINPEIDIANTPFYINTTLSKWNCNGGPRRAGVSSFGIGGTNAHVVLEERPVMDCSGASRAWQLLTLSAKSETALNSMSQNLALHLDAHDDINLSDVAYTLKTGRVAFDYRKLVICEEECDVTKALNSDDAKRVFTSSLNGKQCDVVFMFAGQGAQYVNMGLMVYQSEPIFSREVDNCLDILRPLVNFDLHNILFPDDQDVAEASKVLKLTSITQVAVFVIEYSLAKLFMSWGVTPKAMIGHSLGEYVAACLAGVFSLQDALSLVVARGELIGDLPSGSMLTVALSANGVTPMLGGELSLAASNGVSRSVVSGPSKAISILQMELTARGVENRLLETSHAFHSKMLDTVIDPFTERVRNVKLNAPEIPYISNVTGGWITDSDAIDPLYWGRHIRQTVRFFEGMSVLLKENSGILLEVGPGRTLTGLTLQHPDIPEGCVVLNSMRHPSDDTRDDLFLTTTLGKLWLAGVDIDWVSYYDLEKRDRVPLPTYPFDRKRYWIDYPYAKEAQQGCEQNESESLMQKKNPDISEWFYIPSWKRTLMRGYGNATVDELSCMLFFVDQFGMGAQLTEKLRIDGNRIITVLADQKFSYDGENSFQLNPECSDDYLSLVNELVKHNIKPNRIIHLWSLTPNDENGSDIESFNAVQTRGYYSLLFLAKALDRNKVTENLSIKVLSNNLAEVTGEELIRPEKSTLLGSVKVIQQEYENISCWCIDLDIDVTEILSKKSLDHISGEIMNNCSERMIAYRNNRRLVQSYEAASLNPPVSSESAFKKGGAYLITGGLGGVGLLLAEYLAGKFQAKLMLAGRTILPPKAEWDSWLSEGGTLDGVMLPYFKEHDKKCNVLEVDINAEAGFISEKEDEIVARLNVDGVSDDHDFEAMINKLCSTHIYEYLKTSKVDTTKGRIYSRAGIKESLGLLPQFEKLYNFFLRVLAEDHIVKLEGDNVEFLCDENDVISSGQLASEITERRPGFKWNLLFLDHCVKHYNEALSGSIDAINVLYPEGGFEFLNESNEDATEMRYNRIYMILFSEIVAKIVGSIKDKKVRVLEIGAGNGHLTRLLTEKIKDLNVEYYATDVGRSFVLKQEQEARDKGFNFMKFGVFDISNEPVAQGFDEFSFDIIFGLNVVHATKSIETTIGNLKKLLTPGGTLALIETVKAHRWDDMVWGLAEGWWYFEDEWLRKDSPLISIEKWEEVFRRQGFENVSSYPRSIERRRVSDCALIIAQQKRVIDTKEYECYIRRRYEDKTSQIQNKIRAVRRMESLGAEVLLMSADVANESEMQNVVDAMRQRFGAVNGVVHTAGIVSGDSIFTLLKDIGRFESECQFQPKVHGVYVLEKVLMGVDTDFCMLISSNAAVLGGLGLVAYSAANIFMDFFVDRCNRDGSVRWISANWDGWPTESAKIHSKTIRTSIDQFAMTREESEDAFERTVTFVTGQVIVSAGEIQERIRQWINVKEISTIDGLYDKAESFSLHSRPNLKTAYKSPDNETQKRLSEIWQELLGIDKVGVNDNFFDLGGDSLIGSQLISSASRAFQIELPISILFEDSSILQLAERIEAFRMTKQTLEMLPPEPVGDDEEEGEI